MRITTSFAYIAVAVIAVTASPISVAETPQKALSLVQEYENRKAAAYRTAEESLKTHWTQLMDGLRALQMQYSREGRLNEAIAIRDIVKRLFAERGERVLAIALSRSHSDGEKEINVLIEEMTREGLLDEAVALRGKYTARMANHDLEKKGIVIIDDPGSPGQLGLGPGSTAYVRVIGLSRGGGIWGTDIYTTDSSLAMAAVHAGILRTGESGIVKVTIKPGQKSYRGTSRNGVTTGSWGPYEMSFEVHRAKP